MNPSYSNLVFKVVGFLHVLNALLYGFILMLVFMTKLLSDFSVQQAQNYGYDISGIDTGGTLVSTAVILVLTILYLLSAYGFFKLKSWQPVVFLTLVIFGILELLYRIVSTGFQVSYLFTVMFMVLWLFILSLVWKNKSMFKN